MRAGLCLAGLFLALGITTARADTPPPMQGPVPAVAELGVDKLISQDELAVLWTYQDRSNAIRQQMSADQQLTTPDRDARVTADNRDMHAVDDAAVPIARKLVTGGFWRDTTHRNLFLDHDVYLVVQHSSDMEMRRTTLAETEPLVAKGLFSGEQYGLMYDRMALLDGRKQRFGSQMHCADGHFEPDPLEDPDKVDAWRQQYGFHQTLAEYQAGFAGRKCVAPLPPQARPKP